MIKDLNSTIEFTLSKKKIAFLFLGSVAFVAVGILFFLKPETFKVTPFRNNTLSVMITGLLGIFFFGMCAVSIFKKLFDNKPGLIIDSIGLTDNSSGIAAGFIPWTDVSNIIVEQIKGQKIILIVVNNPQHYIDKCSNFVTKKAADINYKIFNTPISISANALSCNFETLHETITYRWKNNTLSLTPNSSSSLTVLQ
jgi:hypothetical protein